MCILFSWSPLVTRDSGRASRLTLVRPTSATWPPPLQRGQLCMWLLRSAQRTTADRHPRLTCTALVCWRVRCAYASSLQRDEFPSMLREQLPTCSYWVAVTAPAMPTRHEGYPAAHRPTQTNLFFLCDYFLNF